MALRRFSMSHRLELAPLHVSDGLLISEHGLAAVPEGSCRLLWGTAPP